MLTSVEIPNIKKNGNKTLLDNFLRKTLKPLLTKSMALRKLLRKQLLICDSQVPWKNLMTRSTGQFSLCTICYRAESARFESSFLKLRYDLTSSFTFVAKRQMSVLKQDTVKPAFLLAEDYLDNTAVIDKYGKHTYRDVLYNSLKLSVELEKCVGTSESWTSPARVGVACECNVLYFVAQYATWLAGFASVPLGHFHTDNFHWRLKDSNCVAVIGSTDKEIKTNLEPVCNYLNIPFLSLNPELYVETADENLSFWDLMMQVRSENKMKYDEKLESNTFSNQTAVVIYRMTENLNQQIGIPLSFGTLQTRLQGLLSSMEWSETDTSLLVFSSFDYHNLVTMAMLPLYCGASVVMHPKFYENEVWKELFGEFEHVYGYRINKFMAQELTLNLLLKNNDLDYQNIEEYLPCCGEVSVWYVGNYTKNISKLCNEWFEMTRSSMYVTFGGPEYGNVLYTPIFQKSSMPNDNSLMLTPNVEARIYVSQKILSTHNQWEKSHEGELQLKGPTLCTAYENHGDLSKYFTKDGWFKTGHLAFRDDDGCYQLTDTSIYEWVDSGFKISAGHLWSKLRGHPAISEIEFLRKPNHSRGNSVIAVVVLKHGATLTLKELQNYSKTMLHEERYFFQKPSELVILPSLPKNRRKQTDRHKLMSMLYLSEDLKFSSQ